MRQFLPPPKLDAFPFSKGESVEKQLATAAYWIAVISTVLALIMRGLALFGMFAYSPVALAGKNPISFRTFLEGAVLFYVMAIASTAVAWFKERRA